MVYNPMKSKFLKIKIVKIDSPTFSLIVLSLKIEGMDRKPGFKFM